MFSGGVVVPSINGGVFLLGEDMSLQMLPVSAQDLVQNSPFVADDGTVYVGTKRTQLFMINSESGEIESVYGGAEGVMGGGRRGDGVGGKSVLVGRQDYSVAALDPLTGHQSWNATFSFFTSVSPVRPSCLLIAKRQTPHRAHRTPHTTHHAPHTTHHAPRTTHQSTIHEAIVIRQREF